MRRRYSRDFSPPAPVLPVSVRAPGGPDEVVLEGKVDSGADACAVPEEAIAELDLAPVRVVRASGFDGTLRDATLYHCALEVAGVRFAHVEALATRRRYAIIGRNVLLGLVAKLDGPRSLLTVAPGPSRRGKTRRVAR